MLEKQYTSPTKAIEHSQKIKKTDSKFAYVIPIYIQNDHSENVIGRSRIRGIIGSNKEYVRFIENSFNMLKFTLACFKHFKSGVENITLVIVNSSSPNLTAIEYVTTWCEENGGIVLHRENTGFAHGAFKYAWETLGDKFDYYYVNEQDYMPCRDNWLKMMYDVFMTDNDIGGVGTVLEGPRYKDYFDHYKFVAKGMDPNDDYWKNPDYVQYNLAGTDLFTSAEILKQVDSIGGLNVIPMQVMGAHMDSWDISPVNNELFWQHPILNLGYKLAAFNDETWMFTHGKGYLDFGDQDNLTFDRLAPLCHAQTLYLNKRIREYFSWYEYLNQFDYYPND